MMKFVNLAKKNKEAIPTSWDELYEHSVVKRVRAKYTLNQELAILRQRDAKPDEFAEYSKFVEQCKTEAKEELGIPNTEDYLEEFYE